MTFQIGATLASRSEKVRPPLVHRSHVLAKFKTLSIMEQQLEKAKEL